ncbi:MAG: DUF4198 domain-containing protein [Desulfuromonadaceae bacterium]|nr:DUF4198 domain-containing protein [Desulfuromonadaceae bacterium]
MNITSRFTRIFTVLAAAILLPCLASAHTLWVNATDYAPNYTKKMGARSKCYIGFGHRYPVDDFMSSERVSEYALISNGAKSVITPASTIGFMETDLRFQQPGFYMISVVTKPGFVTMYQENGATQRKPVPKTGIKDVQMSKYFESYAKSLIVAGEPAGNDFQTPVGHRLEIIPLQNPHSLKGDGSSSIQLKLLFNGQPLANSTIHAMYSGYASKESYPYEVKTDQNGIATLKLTHRGPWLIKANHTLPAPKEMQEQCDDLDYTATLTFEII